MALDGQFAGFGLFASQKQYLCPSGICGDSNHTFQKTAAQTDSVLSVYIGSLFQCSKWCDSMSECGKKQYYRGIKRSFSANGKGIC